MAMLQDNARMLRKQYYLSARQVQHIETLRAELGVDSDAEVIRRAIDAFTSAELAPEDRELVEATADALRQQVEGLNQRIAETLERTQATRQQLNDPKWIESIRERTRREAVSDPALLAGVSQLVGAL